MAVALTPVIHWSPVSNVVNKYGQVPVSRFVASASGSGDGSGGVVSAAIMLNDASAAPSNHNVWYVITEIGYAVGNTGVSYVGSTYVSNAYITQFPEDSGTFPSVWILDQSSLIDGGTYTAAVVKNPLIVGREIVATDAIVSCQINTNTNTKAYYFQVRGYKYIGFPIIKRDSHWI